MRPKIGQRINVLDSGMAFATHSEMANIKGYKFGYRFTGWGKVVGFTQFHNTDDIILINDGHHTVGFGYDMLEFELYEAGDETEQGRFPFDLSPTEAQKIIDSACTEWKEKLAKRWGADIVRTKYITINRSFYNIMRKACTGPQHELFDQIFGKDAPPRIYESGDRFRDESAGKDYILCFPAFDQIALVNLKTGNTYNGLLKVSQCSMAPISYETFVKLVGADDINDFIKLT